jgi:S1-C subfamily serine protease
MDTAASTGGRRRRFATSGVGFAIPINAAMAVIRQMQSGGWRSVTSPSGGSSAVTSASRALLGVQVEDGAGGGGGGALIVGVQPGTPAESAGLVAGDEIVGLGGTAVASASDLTAAMRAHRPGDRVQIDWVGPDGQQHSASLRLASGGSAA